MDPDFLILEILTINKSDPGHTLLGQRMTKDWQKLFSQSTSETPSRRRTRKIQTIAKLFALNNNTKRKK